MTKYRINKYRHDQIRHCSGLTIHQMIGEDENGILTEVGSFDRLEDATATFARLESDVYVYSGRFGGLCDITYYELEAVEYDEDGNVDDIRTISKTD